MNNAGSEIATELQSIASELTEASKTCLTWADLKGANGLYAKVASGWIHSAIKKGLLDSVSPGMASVVSQRQSGNVNWFAIRKVLGSCDEWVAEFDKAEPSEKSSFRMTVEGDLLRQSIDLSADEKRVWFKQQSLAWATTLKMLADRIEGRTSPTVAAKEPKKRGRRSTIEKDKALAKQYEENLESGLCEGPADFAKKNSLGLPNTVLKRIGRGQQANASEIIQRPKR